MRVINFSAAGNRLKSVLDEVVMSLEQHRAGKTREHGLSGD